MIRLMADTWQEAVLRPLAMAAPNGWVYSEIMAPDFRFVLAIALSVAALFSALILRRAQEPVGRRPVIALLSLTFLSFVPWMATTGNGRYFMTYLLLIGPLCLGLVSILSTTRSMKASLALLLVGLQGFALYQNNPWRPFDSWQSIPWKEAPYFSIDVDPSILVQDATYVSIANMSLSLVAPQFPASSHWVNLSIFSGADVSKGAAIYEPVRKLLQSSRTLKLFQRSAPREMEPGTNQPNHKAIAAINSYLQPHRLALKEPTDCLLLTSKSLVFTTFISTDESDLEKERIKSRAGFWICSLEYPVKQILSEEANPADSIARRVFERMESLCPRFFAPGQELVGNHPAGQTRAYASSDSSLVVTRDGQVYFQYARTLNPQKIGQVDEILQPGYKLDCTKFKGRAGLPWEREI